FRGESCRPYNVGSEAGISIAELAREVAGIGYTQKAIPIQILGTPIPGVPVARYVPKTARAQKELGLTCTIPLDTAIARTMEWNRAQDARQTLIPLEAAR